MRPTWSFVRTWISIIGLVALPATVLADGVPTDPQILIDLGGDSIPITNDSIQTVQPNGTNFAQFDFVNNGNLITSFTFQFFIKTGFDLTTIDNNFTCSAMRTGFLQGDGGPFFTGCSINYNPSSGALSYLFSGTNPPDGDEDGLFDNEAGEKEGIPTNGHFVITLLGYGDNAPAAGGGTLYDGRPVFMNGFSQVPEPKMIPVLVAGVLLMGVFAHKFRKPGSQSAN